MSDFFVHESSYVDPGVTIGENTKIWYFCHLQSGAVIGKNCSFGQNVNIAGNVRIGDGVKVQNNVSIYEGVELEDYVFCGPSMVFTNDLTPRAKYPKGSAGYKKTLVRMGASIGANATIVCGNTIGRWAMIGSGAVVTKDVRVRLCAGRAAALQKLRAAVPYVGRRSGRRKSRISFVLTRERGGSLYGISRFKKAVSAAEAADGRGNPAGAP